MAASIISGVRDYIAACPLLSSITAKNRHIDWTDETAGNYGISPDGDTLEKKFITGTGHGKRLYCFSIFIRQFSFEDYQRLANSEFIEGLQSWCESQSKLKVLPTLPIGSTPTRITAENGMIFEIDKAGKTGLYQIPFKLYYNKTGG